MSDADEPPRTQRPSRTAAQHKRRLALVQTRQSRLDLPTIMDRVLAADHGSAYVQLAAFCIDVDRLYVQEPEDCELPFGWEVFLTECYALGRTDPTDAQQLALLEDTCLSILEQPPDDQGYGSQLLFAVHDAIDRGLLPRTLQPMFASWSKKPRQLRKALDALWAAPGPALAACATHCLAETLDPKLAPPTREALQRMQAGQWPLPKAG